MTHKTSKQTIDATEAVLSSFWKFIWMFFMQPITLHHQLKNLDIDPKIKLWTLLKKQKKQNNWLKTYLIYNAIF